jgi:hypothetical protein
MTPCDNAIVRSIPGNFSAVLEAGRTYVESMKNDTFTPLEPFAGRWKWEPDRVLRPGVPECSNLRYLMIS